MTDPVEQKTEEGGVTQEQLDQAPEYGEGKPSDQSYSQSQNEIKAPKQEAKTSTAPTDTKQTLEFTHNGKKVTGTLEQVLKWAQQGYDYPQKMQQFNQQTQRWNAEKQQWEKQWGEYRQVDEYAKKNPQWWDAIKQQWQSGGKAPQSQTQGAQPGTQAAPGDNPEIQALKAELAELKGLMPQVQTFLSKSQQEEQKQQDSQLDQEIKSIRDKYKDLDFDSPDESGKSLEYRVLEHANQNGIKSFQTAFRDLCHDQILARAEQQAKLKVATDVQQKSRLGILGKSPTPQTKGFQPTSTQDIRKKSYEDIDREALAELKAMGVTLTGH